MKQKWLNKKFFKMKKLRMFGKGDVKGTEVLYSVHPQSLCRKSLPLVCLDRPPRRPPRRWSRIGCNARMDTATLALSKYNWSA